MASEKTNGQIPKGPLWEDMVAEDFMKAGLLYFVNSTVLWPLGLALFVSHDPKTGIFDDRIGVKVLSTPQIIIDNDPSGADHPRYRAATWIAGQLAAMTDAERAIAVELLSDPLNVAAFLTDNPDTERLKRPNQTN